MKKLDAVLENKHLIGIAGHVRPDGDCVGSTLAVYNYIRTYYPDADVRLYLEPIPNIFKFLRYSEEIKSEYTDEDIFDLFIALDCGDTGRLGNTAKYFESAKHTYCVDHHVSNQAFAEENYIFPEASSTCELVYELMDAQKVTKEIAECLYTGMVHDTGVFQYSNTTPNTLRIAAKLLAYGFDFSKLIDETFFEKTYVQNQVLGRALLESVRFMDGRCIFSSIDLKTMEFYKVVPKDLDGIVSQLRTVLKENGQSTELADQVMSTYKAEKSQRYAELKNKLYNG